MHTGASVLRSLGLGPVLDATKASNSAYHTLNAKGETLLYYGAENPAESRGTITFFATIRQCLFLRCRL
jgi:hypothetical protein